MKVNKFNIEGVALVFAFSSFVTGALASDNMRWFKNEMMCSNAQVTVRSYCKDDADEPVNSFCTRQTLRVETLNKNIEVNNLLEKEPSLGNFHVTGLIRCVADTANKPYLYLTLDNGGNCNVCEVSAIIDLDGKWKRYGKRWYVNGKERKEIEMHETAWFKQDSFLLKNKIEDLVKP
jgi:hypothetical protein